MNHQCFWCNKKTRSLRWACDKCYIIKESVYKKCREEKITNWYDIMERVYIKVGSENGEA